MLYVDVGSKFTLLCVMGPTCWNIKIKIGADTIKSLEPQEKQVHFYNPWHMEPHRETQYLLKMCSETIEILYL